MKCFSFYGTSYSAGSDVFDGDDYLRFGATALLYDAGELKAWSVDENGVVKWDTHGVTRAGISNLTDINTGMTWTVAQSACATNG